MFKALKVVGLVVLVIFLSKLTTRLEQRSADASALSTSASSETTPALSASLVPSSTASAADAPKPLAQAALLNEATPKTRTTKAWDEPGWQKCLQQAKRSAKMQMYPTYWRYIDGRCVVSDKPHPNEPVQAGTCFMEAVGPSELYSATKVEVRYTCPRKDSTGISFDMACTNKKGHYMPEMIANMPTDARCEGFPNLLAEYMVKPGPNRAIETMGRGRSNSGDCERQVRAIRRLENDSRFDTDRSLRIKWSEMVDAATAMRCDF